MTRCLVHTVGGEIPRVPSAAIKNTRLAVYVVLWGLSTGSSNHRVPPHGSTASARQCLDRRRRDEILK